MDYCERVMRLIYDAIGEINDRGKPQEALERSPDTVLIGESGKLDSLGFVDLAVTLEEKIERNFNKTIHVVDVLLSPEDSDPVTVVSAARRIATQLEGGA